MTVLRAGASGRSSRAGASVIRGLTRIPGVQSSSEGSSIPNSQR